MEFPFKVEVVDRCEDTQEIDNGDILNVKKISGTFDLYGIIVETRKGRYKHEVPLCELEVRDINPRIIILKLKLIIYGFVIGKKGYFIH